MIVQAYEEYLSPLFYQWVLSQVGLEKWDKGFRFAAILMKRFPGIEEISMENSVEKKKQKWLPSKIHSFI